MLLEVIMLTKETSKKLLLKHISKATPDPLDRSIGRIYHRTVFQRMKWWESLLLHFFTSCMILLCIYLLLA